MERLKINIKCDNMTAVKVLLSGRNKDAVLDTCARKNICQMAALFNISIHIEHILGKQNVIADLLHR